MISHLENDNATTGIKEVVESPLLEVFKNRIKWDNNGDSIIGSF